MTASYAPIHPPLPGLTRSVRVLLAMFLLLAQVLLAAHEVHHLGDGSDAGYCELCLIGGGLDQAQTVDPSSPGAVPAGVPLQTTPPAPLPRPRIAACRSRGPPSRILPV